MRVIKGGHYCYHSIAQEFMASPFLFSLYFLKLQNNPCPPICLVCILYDTRLSLECSCMISKPFSLSFKSNQHIFEFLLYTRCGQWKLKCGSSLWGGAHARADEMIYKSVVSEYHQKLNSSRSKE